MFLYINTLFKVIITVLIVSLVGGIIFVAYNNISAIQYTAPNIVQSYLKILDNPAKDAVTGGEKSVLQEIVETGAVASWLGESENQIKTLRNFKQNNPIKVGPIEYSGNAKEYGIVVLNFENDFKNPESKIAKLYLQRQGNLWSGFRWRIYKIDLPKESTPIEQIKDKSQDLIDNLPTLPKIQNPFNTY